MGEDQQYLAVWGDHANHRPPGTAAYRVLPIPPSRPLNHGYAKGGAGKPPHPFTQFRVANHRANLCKKHPGGGY